MNNIISIISPIYNEEKYVDELVESLLIQKVNGYELELLLVEGMSSDRSREKIEALARKDSRIRLLINERQKTPFAFNIGLREARGDHICIFGAHAHYDPDYISVCLSELEKNEAVGVTGRILALPPEDTVQAKCVSWAFSSSFGASGKSWRTQPEGYVDTAGYPVFIKQPLLDLGGYDERLARNQDNDMNFRLRQAGYKLYCTWKTTAHYQSKKKISEILHYAIRTGRGNAVSLKVSPGSLSLRHHIPTIFTGAVLLGIILSIIGLLTDSPITAWLGVLFLLAIPLHLLVGILVSLRIFIKEHSFAAFLMPAVFFLFHFCYGFGTFNGLLKDKPDTWVET